MKIFEMFSGYGGASFALKKAGIEFECVGHSEIDKYAIQCYDQNHKNDVGIYDNYNKKFRKDKCVGTIGRYCGSSTNAGSFSIVGSPKIKNYGDCTKINPNELPDFDLLTGGFPCPSFSVAGKGLGESDPRGKLFNEIIRIAEVKNPRYMLLENVKGLTNKKHKEIFNKMLSELDRIGYFVHWKVLNSKEYGIPQNRERIFFICFRKDEFITHCFEFPKKKELKIFLRDILEDEVDEKYYLKESQVISLMSGIQKSKINPEIAATLQHPGHSGGNYRGMNMIQQVGMINQICKKRVYDTPKEINEFLRASKGLWTLTEISSRLELPKTQVDHYFRTDESRAIPSPKVWKELKELLCLRDDYDSQVMEIYEKEIEFESTRRVYSEEGCSPTISSTNADKLIQIGVIPKKILNDNERQRRVYSPEGCSPSILNRSDSPKIIQLNNPRHSSNRIYHSDGISPTMMTQMGLGGGNVPFICSQPLKFLGRNQKNLPTDYAMCVDSCNTNGIREDYRIRRLTPKECFRIMGFLNDEINLEGLSNTQKYKLAGNGWDINLVSKIFKEMFSSSNLSKEKQ